MEKGWERVRKVGVGKCCWGYFLGLAGRKANQIQLSLLIISFISTLDPLSMLVSRLFPQIKLLYRSYALASYNNAASGNSIFNRILQTRNFSDFMSLHKDNQSEFNGELFASTSKHINSLISGRDRIKFPEVDELFKQLQAVNVDSLNERHTISILSVLRNIKNRGFIPNGIFKFKEVLVKRYNALIKDREPTENDITDFINAYYEVCSFHGNECRVIASKLLKALETANEKGKATISDNQIGFLFYAFSLNSELSSTENRIRSLLMQRVNAEIETMKIHDLIKIAVNLNRSDSFNFEPFEFRTISKITEKILNSIPDLEERSIYDLIRSENVGKLPGFVKIYDQIHRNIFNEINDNGETELTYDSTFRILGYLSDKVNLKESNLGHRKFFALVSKYAKQCNQENNKQFPIKLFDLIRNNYLSHEYKETIVKILSETKPHLNTNLLYEMAVKGYEIGAFSKFVDSYEVGAQRIDVLVKLGIIVNQMIKNRADMSGKFQQIEAKLTDYFVTPEKFIEFYRVARNERNESISLRAFHEAFSHLFNKLPNPYETETEGASPSYREHYLQYAVDSFKNKELGQFFSKYEKAIKTQDFASLIIYNSKGDAREIEFSKLLIQQLNKRVYDFIESKNRRWIGALIDFINKHSRYVVSGKLDANSHTYILRMLHCLIGKSDVLAESDQDFYLFTIVEKFLVKNHHNYNVEASYRNLLRHVVQSLDKINQKKHHLFTTALHEGLRLNMITPKSLENIVIDKLYLSFMERARIEYIKDNKYTPKIDKINQASLFVFFTNHNLEKEFEDREKQVTEVINNLSARDIVEYLAIYRVNNHSTGRRMLAQLLSQLIIKAKGKSLERHNVIGMLQNAQEQGFYNYYQFKNITEILIEDYSKRISNYELENHLQLIKFIITQPNLNPADYYQQVVDFATKRDDITINQFQQLLLRLANTNYKFKPSELKEVTSIMKKNHFTGIFFFLMVEQDLEPAFRKETVKQFVERFNEKKDGKETFNKLYYQYLKKVYPEETAELNIGEPALYYQKFSIKPRDAELLNTIIEISGGASQELPGFGENYILKIKNFGLNFIYGKKLGAYHDHEFAKRAIRILAGEDLTFVGVHFYSGNSANTFEYLNKQCPGLFDKDAYEIALKNAKNKKQNRGQAEI